MSENPSTYNPFFTTLTRFSTAFIQNAIQNIALPLYLLTFISEEFKGRQLGLASGSAALLSLLSFLFVGNISDSISTRIGRRKPFILLGALICSFALLGFALTNQYSIFIATFLIIMFSTSMMDSAHIALIPDTVPKNKRGESSAYLSFFQSMGAAGGSIVAGSLLSLNLALIYLTSNRLLILNIFLGLLISTTTILTMIKVKEEKIAAQPFKMSSLIKTTFSFDLFKHRQFFFFILFRAIMMLAVSGVPIFLLYFVRDYLRIENYTMYTSMMFLISVIGSITGAFSVSFIYDRYHKKSALLIPDMVCILSIFLFFVFGKSSNVMASISIFLYGLGFGGFFTSATSHATLLIPEENRAGKYMGLVLISTILPRFISPLICGFLLDYFNPLFTNAGYIAIFIFFELCLIFGTAGLAKMELT